MNQSLDDHDTLLLILLGPIILPMVLPLVAGWLVDRQWLMERGLIAPAGETIWAVPGWDGAGIGGVQVVIVSCFMVTLMVIGSVWAKNAKSKKVDIEGWGTN